MFSSCQYLLLQATWFCRIKTLLVITIYALNIWTIPYFCPNSRGALFFCSLYSLMIFPLLIITIGRKMNYRFPSKSKRNCQPFFPKIIAYINLDWIDYIFTFFTIFNRFQIHLLSHIPSPLFWYVLRQSSLFECPIIDHLMSFNGFQWLCEVELSLFLMCNQNLIGFTLFCCWRILSIMVRTDIRSLVNHRIGFILLSFVCLYSIPATL